MSKKLLSILLAVLLLFTAAGCSQAVPGGAEDESSTSEKISVKVTCDCTAAVDAGIRSRAGYDKLIPATGIMFDGTLTLDSGSTALDAIKSAAALNGAAVVQKDGYISSVKGLKELDCGGTSGWMFAVNNVWPSVSAKDYVLSDGDEILLIYSVVFEEITGIEWAE